MRRCGTSCGGARAPALVTRDRLISDLRELGLGHGDTVMLHASVSRIGWIVGGGDELLHALFDLLGHAGTLMMQIGWDGSPYDVTVGAPEVPDALAAAWPAFDPTTARAVPDGGILGERVRTWPGAARSDHPDSSFVAVGRLAEDLVADHPLQYGMGVGSPLERLCQHAGKILLVGAPLSGTTLLHHAEHVADVPGKEVVHYWAPILQAGQKAWVRIEEFSTEECLPWSGSGDMFGEIIEDYLRLGRGDVGPVGAARSYLFDAAELDRFATEWIEERFRNGPAPPPVVDVYRAQSEDHHSVASLLEALQEEMNSASTGSRRLVARADEYLEDRARRVFVARSGARSIGLLIAHRACRERGILEDAYVEPEFRRRGVLRLMECDASGWLSDEGCRTIQVHVDADNAVARDAWRALGYVPSQEFLERPL